MIGDDPAAAAANAQGMPNVSSASTAELVSGRGARIGVRWFGVCLFVVHDLLGASWFERRTLVR